MEGKILLVIGLIVHVAVAVAPDGYFDSCTTTCVGWTCDSDTPSQATKIHVYSVHREQDQEVFRAEFVANVSRSDLVQAGVCNDDLHGFSFDLSPYVWPGRWELNVYAIDDNPASGDNPQLGGSPHIYLRPGATSYTAGSTVTGTIGSTVYGDYTNFYEFAYPQDNFMVVRARGSASNSITLSLRPDIGPANGAQNQHTIDLSENETIYYVCEAASTTGYFYVGLKGNSSAAFSFSVDVYPANVQIFSKVPGTLSSKDYGKYYYTDAYTTFDKKRSIAVVDPSDPEVKIMASGTCGGLLQTAPGPGTKTCYDLPTTIQRSYWYITTTKATGGSAFTVTAADKSCDDLTDGVSALSISYVAVLFFVLLALF